jgi:C1A family cysteine protease
MLLSSNWDQAAFADRTLYEHKFTSWMQEFMIQALSEEVFNHYFDNFIENDKFIEAHNAGNNTFTVGHNQFSHMNSEEFSAFVKAAYSKVDFDGAATHEGVDMSALPTSVDWTTKGAVTPVKNQGQCGSCWSFSATGALEGASFIKYGTLNSLSEQHIVDCDTSDYACNGGWPTSAFNYVQKNGGICSEAAYPYTSGNTGRAGTCGNSKCTKVANSAPKGYTNVAKNSDSALMSALVLMPVSVLIEADQQAFQLYKSGVFTASCGNYLDHAVLAVGYGTYTDGQDYYKVKNSWGTSWGMQGYILMQRGAAAGVYGKCGILSGPPVYPNF